MESRLPSSPKAAAEPVVFAVRNGADTGETTLTSAVALVVPDVPCPLHVAVAVSDAEAIGAEAAGAVTENSADVLAPGASVLAAAPSVRDTVHSAGAVTSSATPVSAIAEVLVNVAVTAVESPGASVAGSAPTDIAALGSELTDPGRADTR
jgi:hypothetical protein